MAPWHRFVDRDAFARSTGIGIGCQRFQASKTLDIQVGPDYTANANNQPNSGDLVELEVDESDNDVEGG